MIVERQEPRTCRSHTEHPWRPHQRNVVEVQDVEWPGEE